MRKLFYLLAFFCTSFYYAQTNGITYQAVIYLPNGQNIPGQDIQNSPMTNRLVCLQFSLIDDLSQLEYQETIQTTTDEFGMVNLLIGSGTQTGGYASSFNAVIWNNTRKSLKVELDALGNCQEYIVLSDNPLSAVPFAYAAVTANNVSGIVAILNGGTGASNLAGAKINLQIDNVDNTSDAAKPISTATQTALDAKEALTNKSSTPTLGTSDVFYPTQNAVKTYVDAQVASATIADADAITKGKIQLAGDLSGTAAAPTVPALATKENTANKSTVTTLGTSDDLFPTQNAVKTYVDAQVASATIADADAITKGKIQLAGDLSGTAAAPTVPALATKENTANKSTVTTLGTSDDLFPTQNAVKTYVDSNISTVNGNNTALQATVTANATAATNTIAAVQTDVDANEITSNAADVTLQDNINALQNTVTTNASNTASNLALKENTANKSTVTTLGTSDDLFPTQNAVKTYVDTNISTVNANNTALQATVTANATAATNAIGLVQADVDANETAANTALALKEDAANKTLDLTTVDGTSDIKFPSAKATKDYVDLQISTGVVDASTTVKGKIQLAGDLGGTAELPSVPGLTLKENAANKSTVTTLGTSDDLFPTQNAVKTYVDTNISTVNANNAALQATVTANATAATNAIAAVQADVDANEITSNAADALLQNNIDTNQVIVSANIDATNIAVASLQAVVANNQALSIAADMSLQNSITTLQTVVINNQATSNAADAGLRNDINTVYATSMAADAGLQSNIDALQNTVTTNEANTTSNLALKENVANKSTDITADGNSTDKYPSVKVIKDYVDTLNAAAGVADNTITSAKITDGTIMNIDVNANAAIDYSKLNLNNSIVTSDIIDNTVTTAKIVDGTILVGDLADDAVEEAKIKNENVTYAKIQNVSATDKVLGRVSTGAGVIEEIATTGSGDVVRATSPTLVTPDLGVPSAIDLTNATGLPIDTAVTGILDIANGGTGSNTQNFVDLTDNQTIGGIKDFTLNATFNGQSIGKGNASGVENLAVGAGAMNAVSTGVRNTAIGNSAMQNYVGTSFDNNTSVGYGNLVALTTGSGNTSVGAESMMALTTGTENTSIGNQSLINTTGSNNIGVGTRSGDVNTTGNNNTFIGTNANLVADNLNNATALGYGAVVGSSDTVQLGNTAVTSVNTSGKLTTGDVTYPNTDGSANQVLLTNGSGLASFGPIPTLNQNTTGTATNVTGIVAIANGGTGSTTKNFVDLTENQTIAGAKTFSVDAKVNGLVVGKGSGNKTYNTAFGYNALGTTNTADFNTALGYESLFSNTAGVSNVASGYRALFYNSGSYNVAIGNSSLYENNDKSYNVAIGYEALRNTRADGNTSLGYKAGDTNTTGTYNTIIGYNADLSDWWYSNATALGNGAIVTAPNSIQLGNASVTSVKTSGKLTTGDVTYPNTDGTANQVLLTNGSGVASFGPIPTLNQNTSGTAANVTGTIAIANGGTGQTTKNAAFDALSPMTTAGDIIYGGTSGTGTRLAKGTDGQVLTLASGLPSWVAPTGVTMLAAIGSTPNANGASISGVNLNLQPADASFGGVVTTGTQTFAGAKTFSNDINVNENKFGRGAGSSGSRNIAIGINPLNSNTTGTWNTAVGAYALQFNTTSSYNTAIGNEAISNAIPGFNNTGIGNRALMNTTGNSNTAIGSNSLLNSTIGNDNTAIGKDALKSNTSGSNNIGIGVVAGANTSTGDYNISIGKQALQQNISGSTNIAVGAGAIDFITTGNNNTVLGGFAGRYAGTGFSTNTTTLNNSMLLGYDTRPKLNNDSNEIVIGNSTVGNGSNTTTIGNTATTDTYIYGNLNVTGQLKVNNSVLSKSATYAFQTSDNANLLVYTGASAGQTITLPSAVTVGAGREITIKNIASVSVGINAAGGNLISDSTTTGATSLSIGIEPSNNWIKAISDGTNWIILRALF